MITSYSTVQALPYHMIKISTQSRKVCHIYRPPYYNHIGIHYGLAIARAARHKRNQESLFMSVQCWQLSFTENVQLN